MTREIRRHHDRALCRVTPGKIAGNMHKSPEKLRELLQEIPENNTIKFNRDIDSADLEIVVVRTSDDELNYYSSYFLPENVQTMETPEVAAKNLFGYAVFEGYAGHALPEVASLDFNARDSIILRLSPTADGEELTTTTDGARPGEELADLIAAMDNTLASWGIQILMSSKHYNDKSCRMEIRIITGRKGQSEMSSSRRDIIRAIRRWNKQEEGRSYELRELAKPTQAGRKAYHPENSGFTASYTYSVGFLPVPRDIALNTGVGGTVSGLEPYSPSQIRPLVGGRHSLGYESNVDADVDMRYKLHLGLPDRATAVLHTTTNDNLLESVVGVLERAYNEDDQLIVFCHNKQSLSLYAHLYYYITGHKDTDIIERISVDALDPLSLSRQSLREWGHELISDEEKVYFFDFSDVDRKGACASTLLYEVSNGAASLTSESPADQITHGHVVISIPSIIAEGNSKKGLLKSVLQTSKSVGLCLDIVTTYNQANSNEQTVKHLVDAVDATSADNAGQPTKIINTNKLPRQERERTNKITTLSDQLNAVRINAKETFTESFVVPMLKNSSAESTPSITEIKNTNTYPRTLTDVLDTVCTIELPDQASTSESIGNRLQTIADDKYESTTHPPRSDLPATVKYDETRDCYVCISCRADNTQNITRRECTHDGLQRVIECCSSLSQIERETIRRLRRPSLKVDPEDVDDQRIETRHLHFLKALYLVQTERVDPYFEYSPLLESGTKIRDTYGLDSTDIEMLENRGYITIDRYPHILYSLKTKGRRVLNEPWKQGHEFGAHIGELNETLQHRLLVNLAALTARQKYGGDPNYHVKRYVPVETSVDGETKQKNIDVAVVDSEDNIIHAREVECLNNDEQTSLVETYQKMCAVDPQSAHWVIPKGRVGTNDDERGAAGLLDSLATLGAQGTISYSGTTYASSVAVSDMEIDEPGITAIQTYESLKKKVGDIEQVLRKERTE